MFECQLSFAIFGVVCMAESEYWKSTTWNKKKDTVFVLFSVVLVESDVASAKRISAPAECVFDSVSC